MKPLQAVTHVALPLLLGTVLYGVRMSGTRYPEWVIYNLPDGLWLYSLISTLSLIWKHDPSATPWIVLVILLSLISEFSQLFKLIPGTFDIGDLIAYALGSLVAFLIHSPSLKPLHI